MAIQDNVSREWHSLNLRPDWRWSWHHEPDLVVEVLQDQRLWQAPQLRGDRVTVADGNITDIVFAVIKRVQPP